MSRAFATKAGDALFSLSRDEYDSRIVCPNGVKGAEGGIVFLVHGTALTGEETWATGPFVTILPTKGYVAANFLYDVSAQTVSPLQCSIRCMLHRNPESKLQRCAVKWGIRRSSNPDSRAAIQERKALHCWPFPGKHRTCSRVSLRRNADHLCRIFNGHCCTGHQPAAKYRDFLRWRETLKG